MSARILVIRTFPFPSFGPGTLRTESFCRYLQEDGHAVTLLALEPNGTVDTRQAEGYRARSFELIRVPGPREPAPLRRRLESWLARAGFPELQPRAAMICSIAEAGDQLLARRRFDCMLATHPPMGTLRVADSLARKHRIPWIADLRDIPDEIDVHRRRWITRRSVAMLSRVCLSASHIVTVSDPLRERLRSHYGLTSPVSVVHNGFEEDLLAGIEIPQRSNSFRITYCGHLSYGRNPVLVLDALELLASRGVDLGGVGVHFYGTALNGTLSLKRRPSWAMVHCHGRASHHDTLVAQAESAVLLSLASPGAPGILTSKIFEYAMIGRPVLSIPADNSVLDDFVRCAAIGTVCDSAEEVARFLEGHLGMWRKTGLLPRTEPKHSYLQQFSRKAQSARLAAVVMSILSCGGFGLVDNVVG